MRAGTDSVGATTVDAKHLTIVGGAVGSRGVRRSAAAPTATAASALANSIVRGSTDSVAASKRVVGDSSTCTTPTSRLKADGGTVTAGVGNLPDVDPAFLNAAAGDYSLRAGSPVVDKGDRATAPPTDRNGNGPRLRRRQQRVTGPRHGRLRAPATSPPPSRLSHRPPPRVTNDNTPVFQFRSDADGARFECRLDGGAFQPCTNPVTTTTALPDGPHSLTVRATDRVFNVEANPPTPRFTVDTVAPDTRFTKKAPKRFFKKRVKFKFASTEAGAHFQCKLDGRAWRSCGSTFKYGVKRGKHTILVRAVDRAGNTDKTPARYKFKRVTRHR